MTKTKIILFGTALAAAAGGASVWLSQPAAETSQETQAVEPEKRDCGALFIPNHVKEKLRPECK